MSGPLLARLVYVMELFGADMLAAELILGRMLRAYYSRCFSTHIMLRDIKCRWCVCVCVFVFVFVS